LEVEEAIKSGKPRETGKKVVRKDINDLDLKPSGAMHHRKWGK